MPLKAIFKRSPLMPLNQVRLSMGLVKTGCEKVRAVYARCLENIDDAAVLEGGFGLSCLISETPMKEAFGEKITACLNSQKEDGGYDLSFVDQIALNRAALCVFELTTQKSILEKAVRWCAYLEVHWDELLADNTVRQDPADLMDYLIRLYRITGTKAILRLCSRLRSQAMDWTGILVTFDQKQGLKKQIFKDELFSEMEKENRHESGYYTRKYLSCRAENLADGLRYATVSSLYSGNGQEANAAGKAWANIKKYHQAVCGGTTADPVLQGRGTHRAVETLSLGAWCEAFCNMMLSDHDLSVAEDIEDLIYNGLSAVVGKDGIGLLQRVNSLTEEESGFGCYEDMVSPEEKKAVVARLSRAYAFAFHSAVSLTEGGVTVNLMLPGKYTVESNGQSFMLEIKDDVITVHCDDSIHTAIFVTASSDKDLHVNDGAQFRVAGANRAKLDKEWKNGDRICSMPATELEVLDAHHQSLYVKQGKRILSIPATEGNFAYALCGTPEIRDGKVFATFRKVKDWKVNNGIPANVAVLPETAGETVELEMKPYSSMKKKMTVFPKGV